MPIHQALITNIYNSPAAVRSWTNVASGSTQSSSVTFTNLQSNDLIFIVAGADSANFSTYPFTDHITEYTQLFADDDNSISHALFYKIYTGSDGSETVPEVGSSLGVGYSFAFAMRSSTADSSYTLSVENTFTNTGSSPTHNNTNVSFAAGELALLLAWQDDDDASPMNPPSDSTDIAEEVLANRGSAGAAFKSIQTAGNYSWGAWSTTDTDSTLTKIVKVS